MATLSLNTIHQQHCAVYTTNGLPEIDQRTGGKRTICITDTKVFSIYKREFPSTEVIVLKDGEHTKSFESVQYIMKELIRLNADKQVLLLGIGGGVICDLTGFVASIYMRGVVFGLVPTTLLAQVDASVGGKNGINFDGVKNVIGAVNQPEFVLCSTKFLSTLLPQDYRSAFAEIVKCALIDDQELFQFIETRHRELLTRQPDTLNMVIGKTLEIKCRIVEADPFDQNHRLLLNFGHTFGHAIEIHTGMRHGEAVSIGMIIAMNISVTLGFLQPDRFLRARSVLSMLNLPVEVNLSIDDCINLILFDKKRKGTTINLILLKDIGQSFVHPMDISELKSRMTHLMQS